MTEMRMGSNVELPATPVRTAVRWTPGPGVPEIDASALLLLESGQVGTDADFVFYNQPTHPSGAVRMAGRTTTPKAGDQIDVDLTALPAATQRVVVVASATGGTFGQVPGLEVVVTDSSGQLLASFAMEADQETAFVCGEIYRRGTGWKFRAVGQGYASGLAGLANDFGISTGDSPSPAPAAPAPAAPAPAAPAPAAPAPTAPPPAAPAPAPAPAPSLDLSPPAPVAAPPTPSAPAAPVPSAEGALDLDRPWPPR